MSECGLVREWGREWGRARERWFGLQERASEEMRATQPRFKQVAWHVPSTYMVEVSASVMTSKVENIILALDKEVRSCTEEGEQLCVSLCVSVCVCVCLCVSVCESEKKKRPVDSLAFLAQTRTQHKTLAQSFSPSPFPPLHSLPTPSPLPPTPSTPCASPCQQDHAVKGWQGLHRLIAWINGSPTALFLHSRSLHFSLLFTPCRLDTQKLTRALANGPSKQEKTFALPNNNNAQRKYKRTKKTTKQKQKHNKKTKKPDEPKNGNWLQKAILMPL